MDDCFLNQSGLFVELMRRFRQGDHVAATEDNPAGRDPAKEKTWFLNLAGLIMQRKLIDHARPLSRKSPKIALEIIHMKVAGGGGQETLQYVEDLLSGLATVDPKLRSVVEGRVFLGHTLAEIAAQLNCSERSAAAYWAFARRWLAEQMDSGNEAA